MVKSRKLKIWTIVSHGLIIIGAGHGFLFMFMTEILTFPYLTNENFSFSFTSVDNHFSVIGLTTLLGQVGLIFSILHNNQKFKNAFQIIGLCLLWISITYLIYDASNDPYIHIALATALPFAICTLTTFSGQLLKRIYKRTVNL